MKKLFLILFLCSAGAFAQINPENIKIVRDKWGVPHIYAKTDPEVAYGLAWANAEDDFVGLIRCFGPMYPNAVARQVFFKTDQQLGQLAEVVLADLLTQCAQAFQFFAIRKLGGAFAHQEIHRAAETLAQEGIADDILGPGAEAD